MRVVARRPLLRAGLERLAADAGLQVVGTSEAADLVLCCTDDTAIGSPAEIVVTAGNLVIRCTSEPDPFVWETVRGVLARMGAG